MKIRLFSAPVALCLIAFMLMASAWAAEYPLTITDSAGREVTFNQPIERVIVTSSDAAEAVVMLGAADNGHAAHPRRAGGARLRHFAGVR